MTDYNWLSGTESQIPCPISLHLLLFKKAARIVDILFKQFRTIRVRRIFGIDPKENFFCARIHLDGSQKICDPPVHDFPRDFTLARSTTK